MGSRKIAERYQSSLYTQSIEDTLDDASFVSSNVPLDKFLLPDCEVTLATVPSLMNDENHDLPYSDLMILTTVFSIVIGIGIDEAISRQELTQCILQDSRLNQSTIAWAIEELVRRSCITIMPQDEDTTQDLLVLRSEGFELKHEPQNKSSPRENIKFDLAFERRLQQAIVAVLGEILGQTQAGGISRRELSQRLQKEFEQFEITYALQQLIEEKHVIVFKKGENSDHDLLATPQGEAVVTPSLDDELRTIVYSMLSKGEIPFEQVWISLRHYPKEVVIKAYQEAQALAAEVQIKKKTYALLDKKISPEQIVKQLSSEYSFELVQQIVSQVLRNVISARATAMLSQGMTTGVVTEKLTRDYPSKSELVAQILGQPTNKNLLANHFSTAEYRPSPSDIILLTKAGMTLEELFSYQMPTVAELDKYHKSGQGKPSIVEYMFSQHNVVQQLFSLFYRFFYDRRNQFNGNDLAEIINQFVEQANQLLSENWYLGYGVTRAQLEEVIKIIQTFDWATGNSSRNEYNFETSSSLLQGLVDYSQSILPSGKFEPGLPPESILLGYRLGNNNR